jgi:fermentation-respiration switch protein FrsA (DUF1100 family)
VGVGACCAAILTACLLQPAATERVYNIRLQHPPFKFSILVSGFHPRDTLFNEILDQGLIATKSLFVVGRSDELITPEMSEKLATRFSHPRMYYHDKGHVVPGDKLFKQELDAFLTESRL